MYGCHSGTTQTIHVIEAIIALASAVIGLLLLVQNRSNSHISKAKARPHFKTLFSAFPQRLFAYFTYLCQKTLAVTRLAISKTLASLRQLFKDKSNTFFTTMDHSRKSSEEKDHSKGNE
ncbi:MAG: hypothetical protein LBG98_03610 [Puniceicoccales bacterium]|jgi:hypothetical protein|nr:hypothetical protein [Puniceicoccales bacterium]